jgi:CRP-like cAMP-binding protein
VGDGRLLATLGAGEGFGEIALLRRSARTASVAARTDVRLRSLDADCFLTVVLGYTPSAREAAVGMGRLLERYDPGQTPTRPVHPDGDQQEVRER